MPGLALFIACNQIATSAAFVGVAFAAGLFSARRLLLRTLVDCHKPPGVGGHR
jgi:hypothetical protein